MKQPCRGKKKKRRSQEKAQSCDPLLPLKGKAFTIWQLPCGKLCVCVAYVCVCELLSHVRLLATPWTLAHQAPLSMVFCRQVYYNRQPFPSPGDLPDPGIKPGSPTLQADSLPTELPGKTIGNLTNVIFDSYQKEKKKTTMQNFHPYFIDKKIKFRDQITSPRSHSQHMPVPLHLSNPKLSSCHDVKPTSQLTNIPAGLPLCVPMIQRSTKETGDITFALQAVNIQETF